MKNSRGMLLGSLVLFAAGSGCIAAGDAGDEDNPFLQDMSNDGKEDTGYVNPDGIEVEVDLEGDVEASSWRIWDAPAEVGQFAVTYLRKRGEFYVESLAEDATSDRRVEWQVDGTWLTAAAARERGTAGMRHFRIRGVNAVLLHSASRGVAVGSAFTAKVPLKPYDVMTDAGDRCAEPDDHMGLSSSIYWYLWDPDRSGCDIAKQDLRVTVSRMFDASRTTYPEYDRLVADGQITFVVLFGSIDDDLTDNDPGVRNMNRMIRNLTSGGYAEVSPRPAVGRRFIKRVAGIDVVADLYSPYEFSGLGDMAHFSNFQKALSEHEIVAYDGHSMLGASDFWSRPTYPGFYQIYLYGGCLGYEYYVRPILAGKGGWENVDIMSSVVEVSADANAYAAPFLAKVVWALENGYKASWKDLLTVVRRNVGDSTFGASGVRDNCFSPDGSLCTTEPPPPTGDTRTYENATPAAIPDDAPAGITSTIVVPDALTPAAVTVDIDLVHTWIGDLRVTVVHDGVEAVLWDNTGDSDDNIVRSFPLAAFAGRPAAGEWTLKVVDSAARDVGTLNRWAVKLDL
ncbi:MAG: proprotein convertase P-domain-containing protein [Deltaproteobacteria bacterium]|nr:proprotein convertase P-domain-containing protein [Deltaproteobacteria bacterium]